MKKIILIILFVIIVILIASCHQLKEGRNPYIGTKHIKPEKHKSVIKNSAPTNAAIPRDNNSKDTGNLSSGNPNISKYKIYNENWYDIYRNFVKTNAQYSMLNVAFSLSKNANSSGSSALYSGTFYHYGQSGIQDIEISVNQGVATVKLLNPPRNSSDSSNISPYIRAILKYSMQNTPIPDKLIQK